MPRALERTARLGTKTRRAIRSALRKRMRVGLSAIDDRYLRLAEAACAGGTHIPMADVDNRACRNGPGTLRNGSRVREDLRHVDHTRLRRSELHRPLPKSLTFARGTRRLGRVTLTARR